MQSQAYEEIEWSKNNIYFEGAAGLVSAYSAISYERKLLSSRSKKIHLLAKGGIGKFGVQVGPDGWGGLGGLTLLTGKGDQHFELSGGFVLGYDNDPEEKSQFALPMLDLGYRYQKPNGGFVFRVKVGILGVGVGVGYAF